MLKIVVDLLIVFIILVVDEALYRKLKLNTENARKLIHLTVSTFVAFLPFYTSYHAIALMALAFFVVILISREFKSIEKVHNARVLASGNLLFPIRLMLILVTFVTYVLDKFKIFNTAYSVKRESLGDLYFPISVGVVALLAPPAVVFMAAILHMGLADGFAAVFGKRFGDSNKYSVFGQTKSVIGTLVFWVISLVILSTVRIFAHNTVPNFNILDIFALSTSLALIENVAAYGTDNLFVPGLVYLFFRSIVL